MHGEGHRFCSAITTALRAGSTAHTHSVSGGRLERDVDARSLEHVDLELRMYLETTYSAFEVDVVHV